MADLDIIIRATDRATPTIKKVGGSVEDLEQKGTKAGSQLAKSLGTGLKVAAGIGAAGILALGGAITKTIMAGSDVEEMMGKFNVVFGDFAEGTITALDQMALAMRRNKFDLRGFAATFQDTFVPMGFARDDAAELSKQLVALTVDLASFNNASETDVLAALQSAIVGNHETMRAYGVIITQATLDQELLNMGIAGGVKEADEMEKAMARLNLIMKGTGDAQGDAERTADSWANTFRFLRSKIEETVAEIGVGLLPILTPLLEKFGQFVSDSAPSVIKAVEDIVTALGNMGEAWDTDFGGIKSTFEWFTNVFAPGIADIWERVTNNFTAGQDETERGWSFWLRGLGDIFRTWGRLFLATLNLFLDGMAGLIKAATGLITLDWHMWLEGVKETFSAVFYMIKNILVVILGGMLLAIKTFAPEAYGALRQMWYDIGELFNRAMSAIGTAFTTWLEGIRAAIGRAFDALIAFTIEAFDRRSNVGEEGSADWNNRRRSSNQSSGMSIQQTFNITGVSDAFGIGRAGKNGVLSAARRIGL